MTRWTFLLGGLVIWAAHFSGAYAIASIADVQGTPDHPAALVSVGAITLVALALNGAILLWAARCPRFLEHDDPELARLWRGVGGLGALTSALFVIWQGLPAVLAV
ncbi:hypothetical protein [Brevundimonas sp.]|uniref:hypothetical protein n=1 Tax=Brevundimonas sp. TaxID=1871086 RepID=UPI0025CDCD2F|nr:hypothetical protein [Brevundimonas sp.]